MNIGFISAEHASAAAAGRTMRIGALAALTGVSVRSLRYYEEQRLVVPARTAAGQRVYSPEQADRVKQVQELYAAGFCSGVIRDLLPALLCPGARGPLLPAFEAARERLESEKRSIDAELSALARLRMRFDLAPHMRVSTQDGQHDDNPEPEPAPTAFDHRDRRLR